MFRKHSQIWFRRLSQAFAQIRKYGFAVFRKDSQGFAIYGFACFARFRKVLQIDFCKDSQVLKSWFFASILNGHFVDAVNSPNPKCQAKSQTKDWDFTLVFLGLLSLEC